MVAGQCINREPKPIDLSVVVFRYNQSTYGLLLTLKTHRRNGRADGLLFTAELPPIASGAVMGYKVDFSSVFAFSTAASAMNRDIALPSALAAFPTNANSASLRRQCR